MMAALPITYTASPYPLRDPDLRNAKSTGLAPSRAAWAAPDRAGARSDPECIRLRQDASCFSCAGIETK